MNSSLTSTALSKDDLDRELDNYMFKDEKIGADLLDKELEDYMAQAQANRGNEGDGQGESHQTN